MTQAKRDLLIQEAERMVHTAEHHVESYQRRLDCPRCTLKMPTLEHITALVEQLRYLEGERDKWRGLTGVPA